MNSNSTPSKSFTELTVWQKAHSFVLEIYKYTESFPKTETYGLTSQIRRASVSIAANIAEGYKKRGIKDKMRFMNISQGSLEEVRYYLILAKDLEYGENQKIRKNLEEVSKLLEGYYKGLAKKVPPKY
jgi:four helix bundle protein